MILQAHGQIKNVPRPQSQALAVKIFDPAASAFHARKKVSGYSSRIIIVHRIVQRNGSKSKRFAENYMLHPEKPL
jgi:hypothetical protein